MLGSSQTHAHPGTSRLRDHVEQAEKVYEMGRTVTLMDLESLPKVILEIFATLFVIYICIHIYETITTTV